MSIALAMVAVCALHAEPLLQVEPLNPSQTDPVMSLVIRFDDGYATQVEVRKQPNDDGYRIFYIHLEMQFTPGKQQIPSPQKSWRVERSALLDQSALDQIFEVIQQSGILNLPETIGNAKAARFTRQQFFMDYQGITVHKKFYYTPGRNSSAVAFTDVGDYIKQVGIKLTATSPAR